MFSFILQKLLNWYRYLKLFMFCEKKQQPSSLQIMRMKWRLWISSFPSGTAWTSSGRNTPRQTWWKLCTCPVRSGYTNKLRFNTMFLDQHHLFGKLYTMIQIGKFYLPKIITVGSIQKLPGTGTRIGIRIRQNDADADQIWIRKPHKLLVILYSLRLWIRI